MRDLVSGSGGALSLPLRRHLATTDTRASRLIGQRLTVTQTDKIENLLTFIRDDLLCLLEKIFSNRIQLLGMSDLKLQDLEVTLSLLSENCHGVIRAII